MKHTYVRLATQLSIIMISSKKMYTISFLYTKSSQYGDYLKTWDANNGNKISVLLLHNFHACEKVRNKNRVRCACSITLTNGILYVLLPGEGF